MGLFMVVFQIGESSVEDEGSDMMVDHPPGTEISAGSRIPTRVIDEEGWSRLEKQWWNKRPKKFIGERHKWKSSTLRNKCSKSSPILGLLFV
ncbi:hypothetical protein KSP40_PGU020905 [Platanthera guangdongensis]|uniref:Uncharacterized protein n=1 Tax=Platanthera guangdongensis TaxID=2320717 RepID=A0ABR2M2U5_9ASPA